MDHVLATFFHQFQVFLGILRGQRDAGYDFGAAAVHLQRTDGGCQNRYMRFQAAEAAFDVPEFFEPDVGCKAGFGDVVVKQFQADAIGNDRRLTHGNVGKRPGMHHTGVVLGGAHQGGVDGIAHESRHGIADFQIARRDGFAAFVKRHGNVVEALFQIGQIPDNCQDGHALGAYRDAEFGLHGESIHATPQTDDNVAQRLRTKIHDPAHFHTRGVDVQAAHAGQPFQLFVVVIALVLHAGSQCHHRQVMGIHDVIDIAGQTQ